jgi:hypothetical protein
MQRFILAIVAVLVLSIDPISPAQADDPQPQIAKEFKVGYRLFRGSSARSSAIVVWSAGMYGISPSWNAASCCSRDSCRMSTSIPLISTFQTMGLSA